MQDEDLIRKWLNNNLSVQEKKQFSELEDSVFNDYIIKSAKRFSASNFYSSTDFKSFIEAYKEQKPVKKTSKFNLLLKIASVIVIGLGLYYTIFFNEEEMVNTVAGEKTILELPDNSFVELNALSSIEYNTKTWDDDRTLTLDGEAYFKVEKGSKFQVKTSRGTVMVLGTEFNVKQRGNYFEVKCFKGVVSVHSDTITKRLFEGNVFLILNNELREDKTSNEQPLWTKNMSEFKAMPFKEVLSEFERQYGIQVIYKNIDTNRLFTGGFPHDNMQNALSAITQPMNLYYTLNTSNMVTIHGEKN